MSHKIAFLFPGQGSQYIGMGLEIANEYQEAREIFEQVDDICAKPISKLCHDGPMDELTLTVNLQPAITAVNLACLLALKKEGISPAVSAGHSLGEYGALVSSGIISSHDALRLVKRRGELMHREALANPGAMAAILGMGIEDVTELVSQARGTGVLSVANHNTAEQIVITGETAPLSKAVELVKEKGGKAIPLKVSGAWHCDLMKNAVTDFREFISGISFQKPAAPMLFNATGQEEDDPEKIMNVMAAQLISPVKWYGIVQKMIGNGIDTFVEVGPKKVLSGLVSKIIMPESDLKIYNVEDIKSLNSFLEAVA